MPSFRSQNIFKGFSTAGGPLIQDSTLYDINLIKTDLSNHFNTRVGERVMRPEYGCRIWDYFMEPLTTGNRDIITQEAIRVCQSDPRVTVTNVNVLTEQNGVRVEISLEYNAYAVFETFTVSFEQRQAA